MVNSPQRRKTQPAEEQPFNHEQGLAFKNRPSEKEKLHYSKVRFTRSTLTSVQTQCSRKLRIFSQLLDQLLGLLRSSRPHLHKLLLSIFSNTRLIGKEHISQLGEVFLTSGKSIAMQKLINQMLRGASSSEHLIQQLNKFIVNAEELIIEKNKSQTQAVKKNIIKQYAKVSFRKHKLPAFLIEHRLSFQRRESLDLLKQVERIEKSFGGLKLLKKLRREQKLDMDHLSFTLNSRFKIDQ